MPLNKIPIKDCVAAEVHGAHTIRSSCDLFSIYDSALSDPACVDGGGFLVRLVEVGSVGDYAVAVW